MGIHLFSLQVSHISSAHMETFSVQLLPEYTPSKPAPDYSSKLLPGEKCIQRSPRLIQRGDNASFTYRQRGMTLKLMDCREEDRHPSYGLGSTIRGEVALDNRRRVVAVAAKLEGRIYLSGQPSKGVTIISKERTLWESSTLNGQTCPSIMPLSMSFPTSYRERGQDRPFRLPPSFELPRPQRVAIVYTLQVVVTKSRNVPMIGKKLSRRAYMSIHIRYRPRVRPSRPVPDSFSEVKQSPEDWMEDVWITKPTVGTGNEAFSARCHLFFPSVRVFTASEKIPFHLRLETSPVFLHSHAKLFLPHENPSEIKEVLNVFILRQTTVNIQGTSFSHDQVLGRGQMTLQSSPTSKVLISESEEPVTWSWNGNLQCEVPVLNTGFNTGQISTSDYIVLSLLLPPGQLRPDLSLQRVIPIRLATEPWVDRS
ncbi:uncharacterized protein F5891DRAFT_1187599 [Suillus fuscotomentosus]|uniref:Uncharacterized protein n=1 Tax=Suillus fuscotomentosus TaxID=1912939 RepID=A0AAD4EAF7_9AGAM|nr:uncharacterized protein F5891DRAFT_1187599 [Suillus fuscotomentosus]KAG1901323.1 hypothetical protein F5891DRAFT_1187599 [Suillus fuscotomentosus]